MNPTENKQFDSFANRSYTFASLFISFLITFGTVFFSISLCRRPTKTDKNSEELLAADRQVEKYKDVLDKICRKFLQNPSSGNANVPLTVDQDVRDKRCKKVHEYKLAQAMEESLKDLPQGLLRDVLENGG